MAPTTPTEKEKIEEAKALWEIHKELVKLWEHLGADDIVAKFSIIKYTYYSIKELKEKIKSEVIKEQIEEVLNSLQKAQEELEKVMDFHLWLSDELGFDFTVVTDDE